MTDQNPTIPLSESWEIPSYETREFSGKSRQFALVIPVINEGGRIRAQLERIKEADLPVDVVIADGGSTDGSLDEKFLSAMGVRALLTKTGDGRLSAQLRMAYSWVLQQGYDGVVTIDGNGKDGVEAVSRFVQLLEEGKDYVQGSRYQVGGKAENTPLSRSFGNRMIHAPMLSLASGCRMTDTTNGFRGYSRRLLLDERVAPFRDIFMNYELLFYLTVRAGQLGFAVCETGVRRSYPRDEPVPTKISGFSGKVKLLAQTISAAVGRYNP